MHKKCSHCLTWFEAKFPNAKLCLTCWKKRERAFAEYDDLCNEVDRLIGMVGRLRAELEARQPAGAIPPAMLKRLIRLCHPDKHGNSETANEATRWLLEQRKR